MHIERHAYWSMPRADSGLCDQPAPQHPLAVHGSVDIHAALENGDALRRHAINISIRGTFRRMVEALGATRSQTGSSIGDRLHAAARR